MADRGQEVRHTGGSAGARDLLHLTCVHCVGWLGINGGLNDTRGKGLLVAVLAWPWKP